MKKFNSGLFWILNLGSWGVFYLSQGLSSPVFLTFNPFFRFILIATFIFWIMVSTSTYRFVYKRFRFDEKSPLFTVIQSFVSALLIWGFDFVARFYINQFIIAFFFPADADVWSQNMFSEVFELLRNNPHFSPFIDAEMQTGQISKLMAIAVWVAVYNFYKFYTHTQNARVERLQIENQLKESELISLRSQLNPHFLFNALNSIYSLTQSNPNKASEAVLLLSDLMRYALNYGKKDLVTVEEEMNMVRKYLDLEKIRFGDKLDYQFDIQRASLSQKIPPIVIQTLTENAIKHGIRQSINGGQVAIKSFLKDNFLTIEIKNTGQLKNSPPSVKQANEDGIGIENTIKRLKMLFGDNAFFSIHNQDDNNVVATVKLPLS